MNESSTEGSVRERLRCRHCQDVIGVYEPLMLVTDLGRHETSLAAAPELYRTEDVCYHRACFEQIRDS